MILRLLLLIALLPLAAADLPAGPFPASRYEPIWTSSPFSVATPLAVESAEYSLVGAAQFDGVSYASLIDKQSSNQDHFVVTSTASSHGLTLVSLVRGSANETFATLQRNGALLKLKLEAGPAPAATPPVVSAPANGSPPVLNSPPVYFHRPAVRYYRRPVSVPVPNP